MPKHSHRESILEAGRKVMFQKGYVGSGIREIVAEASVSQGSFTNHFRSKEEFTMEVLNRYFSHLQAAVEEALQDKGRPPRLRIARYLDIITERLAEDGFARGCLIGDLSLEAASQSEMLRSRLAEIFAEWSGSFANCITEGQASGEITDAFSPQDLAEFFLAGWEGAILRMKVSRDVEPLTRFKRVIFATIFKDPNL
jgi:TetR/AcrR family transcriptional repressor of nem operon